MTIKHAVSIGLLTSLFACQVFAGSCVLPVADGGDVEPSPASVQGVIAKVTRSEITLKEQKAKPIRFGKDTELFTVYGGAVNPQELKKGQHIFVWYVGCKEESGVSPMAAIIQLCSTAAKPCLK